ncbi:hypothetical protein [Fluviicola chungangensis]|uniref:Uncharacterized protein n=1 Tax=Fluviicola chungangensis TaxID=2597671 RepID=A0A556N5Y1_9FLAO|nr:hypothetical protein [Fluviicola chungangensis]TSJ47596.1 hypothetical protein FO442_00265 [Fluviicola chungangensis]
MNPIKFLILLIVTSSKTLLFAQNKENIISEITIQTDYVENGVKGFRVAATCDYNVLRTKYPTDSLLARALTNARFSLKLSVYQDSNLVKPAFGYQKAFGRSEWIEFKLPCNPLYSDSKPAPVNNTVFIPYAALKLKEGKQNLFVSADLSGKDGFNTTHKQHTQSSIFTFYKPPSKIFECSLDSLIVKSFDTNGQAWDHELFGTDAPDLDFSIKMGDLEVGNIHKGNSYRISFPEKPRVFRFLVSENDEVTIFLTDTDDAFHDPIASWRFDTSNMKDGVVYEQKEAKANLSSFSFKCKIGKISTQKEIELK